MMYQDAMVEALKWVAVIFVAGFIGFFGKYLGKVVLSRFQKEEEPEARTGLPAPGEQAVPETSADEGKLLKKMEKGRLKLEKKLAKKSSKEEKP